MNIDEFHHWLVNTIGFKSYYVEKSLNCIYVYLRNGKLHFVFNGSEVDCCLMAGGMATPETYENIIRVVFPFVDLTAPGALKEIQEKIRGFKQQ